MALGFDDLVTLARGRLPPAIRGRYLARAIALRQERLDRANAALERHRLLVEGIEREIRDIENLQAEVASATRLAASVPRSADLPSSSFEVDCSSLLGDLVRRGISKEGATAIVAANEIDFADHLEPHRSPSGHVWEGVSSPHGKTDGKTRRPSAVTSKTSDRLPDHVRRALAIPGYVHSMIMVQATFGNPASLDARALGARDLPPLGLSRRYVKDVLDAEVTRDPDWIASEWLRRDADWRDDGRETPAGDARTDQGRARP